MSQEHLFCAEVYHFLYDHIDRSRPVYFCLDGAAAGRGSREGMVPDSTMPDFWFSFKGNKIAFGMEAKTLTRGSVKLVGGNQAKAWCARGRGLCKPELWIATDAKLRRFYCWNHADFAARLNAASRKPKTEGGHPKTVSIPKPRKAKCFRTCRDLSEYILKVAKERHYR